MGEWRPYCLSKAKLIMAAQRISASSVNWVEFARKIPAAQKASFQAFKQKSDGFVRAVNALPEAAPKIAEIQTELDKWEKMRPFTDMNFEELARQAPQVMGKLGIKDPVQHRYTHMTITDGKMVFEETYDEWVAKVKAHQAQEHQEHLE